MTLHWKPEYPVIIFQTISEYNFITSTFIKAGFFYLNSTGGKYISGP
jgi:hypothetical protein